MREYVISVVAVSVLAALASFISYGGGSERAIKGAVSVILLYTVCMPIADAVGDISVRDFEFEIADRELLGSAEYLAVAEDAFVQGVKQYVCREFDFKESDVSVSAYGFDFEKMNAERIYILLSGSAALADTAKIAQNVTDLGLGKCEVNIKIA